MKASMEPTLIESRNNPLIKSVRALSAAKARRETGLHLIEGERLVSDAIRSGAPLVDLFVETGHAFDAPEGVRAHAVTRPVLEAITDSMTPQAVAATVQTPDATPPCAYPAGLIVVLDGVQDPGNVGTILRSADAFGACGALLSPACADPFSPKALRAAMGSTYHLPIWRGEPSNELPRLLDAGFVALCGHLRGEETLPKLSGSVALVIGSEGNGVSDAVARQCRLYRLPMRGRAESLNASVAAGILLYVVSEALERA